MMTKEEMRRESERWNMVFADMMDLHTEILQRLRQTAEAFFREAAEGKDYQRRPNLSIVVLAEGTPPARLTVRPQWNRRTQTVVPENVEVEFPVERVSALGKARRSVEIALLVKDDRISWCRRSVQFGDESLLRLCQTAGEFLANPFGTFARASDHCCICGRALTDEVSRSRGIGPECHKVATALRRIVERKMAERGEVPAHIESVEEKRVYESSLFSDELEDIPALQE